MERPANAASSRPPRKGPLPQLTLSQVLEAARSIVEANGERGLTMRRLAERLDVSPMALYRYVADKDELLIRLLNESVASVIVPPVRGGPRQEIVAIYRAMHAGLVEQSWALDVLVRGRLIAPAALPLLDRLFGALLTCGLTKQRAVTVNRVLWNTMIGDLVARRAQPASETSRGEGMASVDPDSLPHLAAVGRLWAKAQHADTFEKDLETLVAALCHPGKGS